MSSILSEKSDIFLSFTLVVPAVISVLGSNKSSLSSVAPVSAESVEKSPESVLFVVPTL